MRRLSLLALLLACPAVAEADGLPGTATYPLWGCTLSGYCFTAAIVEVGNSPPGTPHYIAEMPCIHGPAGERCGSILDRRVYFYDGRGELIFAYGNGIAVPIEDLRQPVFGVLSVVPTPESDPPTSPREMILLTTPEPGTLALLGTGLVTMAGALRRKRKPVAD